MRHTEAPTSGTSWSELSGDCADLRRSPSSPPASVATVAWFPRSITQPSLFARCFCTSCLTSLWKVNLPIPLASSSTLSVSYAANLTALLLLGPRQALVIALAGVWTQCTVNVKQRYPWYRTVFSIAAEALTMVATGLVYQWLGGAAEPGRLRRPGEAARRRDRHLLLRQHRPGRRRDRRDVRSQRCGRSGATTSRGAAPASWSPGTAGAVAAVVIARGEHWTAALMIAPVYLTYRTYQVFVGRLEDRDRHAGEARRLHQDATSALALAQQAEQAAGRGEGSSRRDGRRADAARSRAAGAARARARRACQRRRRQPAEGSVPGHGLARAAHAAERHPRLGRHAAHAARSTRACAIAPADRSTRTRGSRRG